VSKQAKSPKIFDPAKLEAMNEPLNVRVEKIKSGARMPIPLPAGDDGSPQGTNWTKEDVNGLEQWLVTDWSGGGLYAITVTDSSVPVPLKHDWESFYHPVNHPEKIPPTLLAQALPPLAISQPSQPQVRPMSTFPNGLPGVATQASVGQQQQQQQPQTIFVERQAPQQQAPFQVQRNEPTTSAAALDAERRRYEDQLKEMQAQLTRAREEQLQAQHRQELERAEARMRSEAAAQVEARRAEMAAQNEKFSKLEQMIATLATAATARPAVDPALEQLKEQNRLMAAAAENDRREREAERREREMRDLIKQQAEDSRRQIEAMNAQMAAAQLAAAANKGPDPMIMFLQENARQQVEAAKESSRNQTTQMAQLQSFMMNPRDIMAMTKESSNGLDNVTRQITSTYQSILEMQRSAVEQILQLNSGGGNETIQLIEKGLDRASSFAERFIGGKTKEAVSAQQSQAQLAQANAAAMQAQAQAMTVQAQMQRQAQLPAESGLNGARVPAPVTAPVLTSVPKTPGNDAWTTGPIPAVGITPTVRRSLGHTDEEWFGPILPKVVELRDGVARMIESLQMAPIRLKKDGSVDGVEPEQAASVILQAAMIVMQQQIQIPAMTDLLGQGRVADFMDVLLPDAPQPYRDEVAQMVLTELQGGADDEDDEDDDEDAEGEEPVNVTTQASNGKPTPQARA
jgi:hypothetical protein